MTSEKVVTCKWCKAEMPDNPGAYYHEMDCHRRDVLRRMNDAEARGVDKCGGEYVRLERELFRASYTGD